MDEKQPEYKLFGAGNVTDAGMDGAQKIVIRGGRHVKWVVDHYQEMDYWQKLHMDMYAANAFELIVRGWKPDAIGRVLGIPKGFIETVAQEAVEMQKRVTDDEYLLYPGAFTEEQIGKKMSCYEWERRIYDWCREKAALVLETHPAGNDDRYLGYNLLLRALSPTGEGKNGFFIMQPNKGLWLAYKNKSYNRVMWSGDMEEAKPYKHLKTAQSTREWLEKMGYKGCVLTDAEGNEIA